MRKLLVSVLVALVAWSCASPSGPSTNATTMSGRAFDLRTDGAVSGAVIVLADPSETTTITERARATTDGSGSYRLPAAVGRHAVFVDGIYSGQAIVHSGDNHRDFFVRWNGCIARYGTIVDGRTGRLVSGATVSLLGVSTTTGPDGSYRLDYGCQGGRWSNTILLSVTRTGYEDGAIPMGRGEGFSDVLRQDVELMPR